MCISIFPTLCATWRKPSIEADNYIHTSCPHTMSIWHLFAKSCDWELEDFVWF